MDRRAFLQLAASAGAASLVPMLPAACGVTPIRPDGSPEPVPVDRFLAQGARVAWIAAHPDDEVFSGCLLARSSIHYGNPLFFLVLTHGEGGECCLEGGCHPDLATVRGNELKAAADRYRAELQHERYWNAPLPVESFPKRHEIHETWRKAGDPLPLVATAIRRFRPDLVLTFDPDHGGTGHPEHQLTSRLATAGIRLAADPAADLSGLPAHRVTRTYYVLHRYVLLRIAGVADPGPVTETFDVNLPAKPGVSCIDFMNDASRLHRTQEADMWNVRYYRGAFSPMNLRQVDPFRELKDPAEPAT
jgi:LmbE family N-acetylglucosaminyl deacetylase